MSNETGNNGNSNAGKIAIGIGIVAIIALLAVIVVLLTKKEEPVAVETVDSVAARGVVVNAENADAVMEQIISEPVVKPGYYTASMTNEWHFANSEAVSSDAYVQNLEENTNDVYFDVFLAEDEDTPIYQSPIIPRGAHLEEIQLNKKLDAGTYDCVLIYHLIDENQKDVSTLRVGIKVIVEQ